MGLTALGLILLVEARSIEGGGASHIITEVAKDCVEGAYSSTRDVPDWIVYGVGGVWC